MRTTLFYFIFFFNDTATTEIYTLSLHDALPILKGWRPFLAAGLLFGPAWGISAGTVSVIKIQGAIGPARSEEHTSELQSLRHLVCRLLLEKKKKPVT